MSWQIFSILNLFFAISADLLRRKLGERLFRYDKVVNLVFFVFVHYPIGIIMALVIGFNLDVGLQNLLIIAVASMVFPAINVLKYRANKNVDASLFGVLASIKPVITITAGFILLKERLEFNQQFGVVVVVLSTLFLSSFMYSKSSKSEQKSIVTAIAALSISGVATVYEVWMLSRIGVGTYFIIGWGFQTFWMFIFAIPQLKLIKNLISKENRFEVGAWAFSNSFTGVTTVIALYLAKNASLVAAFASTLPVLVVFSGHFVLKENKYFLIKIVCSIFSVIGLVLLAL